MSGRAYRYFAVPEAAARGLDEARSKGGCFNRRVRDRFAGERLAGWDPPDEERAAARNPARTVEARAARRGASIYTVSPPGRLSP